MARTKERQGRNLSEYVVTVRMDHHVTVRAVDQAEAEARGLKAAVDRIGAGRNPTVTETEQLT